MVAWAGRLLNCSHPVITRMIARSTIAKLVSIVMFTIRVINITSVVMQVTMVVAIRVTVLIVLEACCSLVVCSP